MKGRLLTEEPYNYEAALSSVWIVEPVLVIKCMSGNSLQFIFHVVRVFSPLRRKSLIMNDLSCKVLENLQQVFLFILAFYETPIFV